MERKILCDCSGLKSDREISKGTEVDYSLAMLGYICWYKVVSCRETL